MYMLVLRREGGREGGDYLLTFLKKSEAGKIW